jgi:hypothetical protein
MNPFQIAERFIQLRKVCEPSNWSDQMTLISDMIVMPLITLFLVFTKGYDMFSVASTLAKTYSTWKRWYQYNDLRFKVQMMYLHTMKVGGPFIVTNDPEYMPYVFADAVYRVPVGIGNSAEGRLLG